MSEDRQRPTEKRDDVGELVRLAGKRKGVSTTRTERVRAAVHTSWREEVRQRSRRRRIGLAVALAAAASVVLLIGVRIGPRAPTGDDPAIRVEAVLGALWQRDPADASASPHAIQVGATAPIGIELATGDGDRAAISLSSGHTVRLDISTRIRLLGERSVALDHGAVYVDSGTESNGSDGITVETAYGAVVETGTQFEVRLDAGSLLVRLREGSVVLRREGRAQEIVVGTEFELGADGSPTTRTISTHGPGWDWILGVTPMLDLEGRSARDFLDWVVRERGWSLEFSDPALERQAEETMLEGSVQKLTLDQVLDAVLPTCGMSYRVDQGVLRVAPDSSN
jgi:ferric-dicitrate binding protein FerR (iron transport regulator)